MRGLYRSVCCCLLVVLLCADPLSILPNDYLSGDGLFLDTNLVNYTLDSTHTIDWTTSNGSNVLKLTKPASSAISFTDGLHHSFKESQPTHITFQFSAQQKEIEDSNLRIKNSKSDKTLISFRAGNSGFIRVNDNQMVAFYNDTLSSASNIITTKVDLIVDWDNSQVKIYTNGSSKGTVGFYHTGVTSVDHLLLYNLNPATSYWKNIAICDGVCYDFKSEMWTNVIYSILFMILLAQLS